MCFHECANDICVQIYIWIRMVLSAGYSQVGLRNQRIFQPATAMLVSKGLKKLVWMIVAETFWL